MIDSFIKFLTYEKRVSAHTINSYSNDLLQFNAFLKHHAPEVAIAYATHLDIRAWIVDLSGKKNKARSINRKISTLRSFYKFLQHRRHIKLNPTHKVKALKANYPLPHFVQVNEVFNLLDDHGFVYDFPSLRDRLMLELLYGTGIRLSEMINLQTANVHLDRGTIKVEGKRQKERVIPCHKSLMKLISAYQNEKSIYFRDNDAVNHFLLVTNNGDACYPMMVYRTVRKYLDQYAHADKRSPHVMRHTFATHLLDNGADLNAIKDLLGHASLAATQVYTHNSMEKLKSVFDQAHPKA
ncbi:tyrosine-type recombinase/integrase [Catalinimonas niigatensis]|uniref:tyrosine-type recombinase/integrase n=1 Tax=Catalinimonas niigatensis TaxID=1397264 RepID=UPI002666071C|nr:tyrosine-type recombinase/integrase [Catalinimonas niigatensis]WPP53491.1 tyrosine-type recombinase/integrase [Catalinimonas niigatensis]